MTARDESEVDEVQRTSQQTTTSQAPQSKNEYASRGNPEGESDRQSKRRRSNRESARRSRERRMQEYQMKCDEAAELRNETLRLQQQVAELTETNNTMMICVPQLAEKCKDLVAENTQLLGNVRKLRRSLRYYQAPGLRVINSMAEASSLAINSGPSCSAGATPNGTPSRLPNAAGPVSSPCQVTSLLQTLQKLVNGGTPSPQTPRQLDSNCFSPDDSSFDGGPMPRQPSISGYALRRPELTQLRQSDQVERTWDPETYSSMSMHGTQISLPVFQYG